MDFQTVKMNSLRLLKQSSTNYLLSSRNFNTSRSHLKALKNWERPSIAEMTIPKDPWLRVFEKNQKRYNAQLALGLGIFSGTLLVTYNSVKWNTTPYHIFKSMDYVTKTPDSVPSISQNEESTGKYWSSFSFKLYFLFCSTWMN